MAVARDGVNDVAPKASGKVAVFGADPIGLGATIGFKSAGVQDVTVVDLIQSRLEKALKVGGGAVINCADDDVVETVRSPPRPVPPTRSCSPSAGGMVLICWLSTCFMNP